MYALSTQRARNVIADLGARGRNHFTASEPRSALGVSGAAARQALSRLAARGEGAASVWPSPPGPAPASRDSLGLLGVSSPRSSTPRARAPISFHVIGSHLHRPTAIPRGADVSSMLAERGSPRRRGRARIRNSGTRSERPPSGGIQPSPHVDSSGCARLCRFAASVAAGLPSIALQFAATAAGCSTPWPVSGGCGTSCRARSGKDSIPGPMEGR